MCVYMSAGVCLSVCASICLLVCVCACVFVCVCVGKMGPRVEMHEHTMKVRAIAWVHNNSLLHTHTKINVCALHDHLSTSATPTACPL